MKLISSLRLILFYFEEDHLYCMQGQQPTTGLAKPRQERPLTFNPTGSYDKLPADLLRDQEQPESPLAACPSCGRKFREDRLEKHHIACAKLQDGAARRGAFNSSVSKTR